MADFGVCVICGKSFTSDKVAVSVTKGRELLLARSLERGDDALSSLIKSTPETISVHEECRKRYSKKVTATELAGKRVLGDDDDTSRKRTRGQTGMSVFRWKEDCVLCGKPAEFDVRHPDRHQKIHQVKTMGVMDSLASLCVARNDDWGFNVHGRLKTAGDLHAADAVYHVNCYRVFSRLSSQHDDSCGRPVDEERRRIFNEMCSDLLESDCETYTLDDLRAHMENLAGDSDDVYSLVQIQRLLTERYGDGLFIADRSGRRNVVCLRNMAKQIMNEKWYEDRDNDFDKECEHVVQSSAALIKASIRETEYGTDEYPLSSTMSDEVAAKERLKRPTFS